MEMNLSPAQKKVIERLGDGIEDWVPEDLWLHDFEEMLHDGIVEQIQSEHWQINYTLTPKGQQLYEDMKKK